MGLSQEQRVEMNTEIRRLRSLGQPENAQPVRAALDREEYFMGGVVEPVAEIVAPKKTAKKEAWVRFALAVSDIDPEVVESATRGDIIGMLKANGLLEANE